MRRKIFFAICLYLCLTSVGLIFVTIKFGLSKRAKTIQSIRQIREAKIELKPNLLSDNRSSSTGVHLTTLKVDATTINNIQVVDDRLVKKTEYLLQVKYSLENLKCPHVSGNLVGQIKVDIEGAIWRFQNMSCVTKKDEQRFQTDSKFLGNPIDTMKESYFTQGRKMFTVYEPNHCMAMHSVAIIIPFRDREEHLKILLGHLHPLLQRQLLRYSVFVISQAGNETFNKARLLNTGFEYASFVGRTTGKPFTCYIFQDIDLLMENDLNVYKCPQKENLIVHFATSISTFEYKYMPQPITVGGVLGMREDQFRKLNGFSNVYWGWGGEDDDLYERTRHLSMNITRPSADIGRYTMIKHERDPGNKSNSKIVLERLKNAKERFYTDGLSDLDTKVVMVTWMPLYTNITVDVGKPPS